MTLIAVSGVDGSGKSTQIELLAESLRRQGSTVVVRWFRPGYSPQAERLKRWLRLPSARSEDGRAAGDEAARRDSAMRRPLIRLAWLLFAGLDAVVEVGLVARVLRRRGTVIYDRWALDARLDLRINFADWPRIVSGIERAVDVLACAPDSALLLIVPKETANQRLAGKDEPFPDSPDVARRRRSGYEAFAARYPHLVIHGSAAPDVVHGEVGRLVAGALA